jgi:hypothetical protein
VGRVDPTHLQKPFAWKRQMLRPERPELGPAKPSGVALCSNWKLDRCSVRVLCHARGGSLRLRPNPRAARISGASLTSGRGPDPAPRRCGGARTCSGGRSGSRRAGCRTDTAHCSCGATCRRRRPRRDKTLGYSRRRHLPAPPLQIHVPYLPASSFPAGKHEDLSRQVKDPPPCTMA